eukprot:Pgem_evm1s19212
MKSALLVALVVSIFTITLCNVGIVQSNPVPHVQGPKPPPASPALIQVTGPKPPPASPALIQVTKRDISRKGPPPILSGSRMVDAKRRKPGPAGFRQARSEQEPEVAGKPRPAGLRETVSVQTVQRQVTKRDISRKGPSPSGLRMVDAKKPKPVPAGFRQAR